MKLNLFLFSVLPAFLLAEDEYEQAPIRYSETQPRDAVYALEKLMNAGQVKLDCSNAWTVLKGLLKQFSIPI